MAMKTTISPVLLELNGLTTVLLPQDQSFQFLMELLRFNFQKKKKMVNFLTRPLLSLLYYENKYPEVFNIAGNGN